MLPAGKGGGQAETERKYVGVSRKRIRCFTHAPWLGISGENLRVDWTGISSKSSTVLLHRNLIAVIPTGLILLTDFFPRSTMQEKPH